LLAGDADGNWLPSFRVVAESDLGGPGLDAPPLALVLPGRDQLLTASILVPLP
jgi:hypothetical protein